MEAICSSSEHAEHAVPPSLLNGGSTTLHNFLYLKKKKKKKFTLLLPLENPHTPPPNPDSILFFCLSLRSLSFTPLTLVHTHTPPQIYLLKKELRALIAVLERSVDCKNSAAWGGAEAEAEAEANPTRGRKAELLNAERRETLGLVTQQWRG